MVPKNKIAQPFLFALVTILAACSSAPPNYQLPHTERSADPDLLNTTLPPESPHHPTPPKEAPPKPLAPRSANSTAGTHSRQLDFSAKAVSQEEALVCTLLTRSSAAKNIQSSGDPEVLVWFEKAKSYYDAALQDKLSSNSRQRAQLLRDAKQAFFQAARLAADPHSQQTLRNSNYHKRLASTRALLAALQRIVKEKNSGENYIDITSAIEQQLHNAEETFTTGNTGKAQEILSMAFLTVKDAVVNLRNGDTLVRSLNFSSPKEEYRYELNRNDTHKLLLTVLFRDKSTISASNSRVNKFVNEADVLRRQAEQQAQAEHFPSAIKLLEKSTQTYIRAIRAAGVYIPG